MEARQQSLEDLLSSKHQLPLVWEQMPRAQWSASELGSKALPLPDLGSELPWPLELGLPLELPLPLELGLKKLPFPSMALPLPLALGSKLPLALELGLKELPLPSELGSMA